MIRNDEKLCRVSEREVVGEHLRLHVAVHADEREILRFAVDLPGDASLLRSERQSPIGMKLERCHTELLPSQVVTPSRGVLERRIRASIRGPP